MKNFLAAIIGGLMAATIHSAEIAPPVTLEDLRLVGDLAEGHAAFTLTATAHVTESKGASLELLSGPVALTAFKSHPQWQLHAESNRFTLHFEHTGKFPLQFKFAAAVRQSDGWNHLEFHVTPSALHPIIMQGLSADTQFEFPGAARPERVGQEFKSFLPADGAVRLAWKEARPEGEGKLFYSSELLSQISVSPGLMSQVAWFDFKVMQGELNRIALVLHGTGEVTRVQGDHVLAWNLEPMTNSADRRLVVQLNQPQKDQFNLQVQAQTPLGAFPQTADVLQLRPESATRFAGYIRVVNEGAVRLEVAQASGLSQISPEQFPETDATRAALKPTGTQRFAYRFSGTDFALRIQADQILPELAVSQVLAYRLGENELAIDGELELDIREAPLRELILRVPKGYVLARLTAQGLNDYFLREPDDQPEAELRAVFGQPVSGRQLIQFRLERNKALAEDTWLLPRIEVAKAKSVHGHIAVASDAGFRLTPERTSGLTEIATAFFPRKVAGIQSAFRVSDPAWQAALRVERLPQTVQADAMHLFSIGEGIAYGSSLLNYVISGAPMSAFKVELSEEYFNVEFTGKDIRGSQKVPGGYLVQLHTSVSGAYTLLATYERPFKPQGETLTFTGARPLDAQSESGYTLIISAYQLQVKPASISPGLLALETGEVPPEYRLFFDAPLLAAYRYGARPFDLKLALSPLAQGDSLSQVVDRASLTTRISKEGQVLTDVRYFLKNRGNPNLRLTLPAGTELWSAAVNGSSVVPVLDAGANLIPLPQGADPNAVLTLDLKLAAPAKEPKRVTVAAPVITGAPVLLVEWKLEPDTGQRLEYRTGSLTPAGGVPDVSGFAQLARTFTGNTGDRAWAAAITALALAAMMLGLWRWASSGAYRGAPRQVIGTLFGILGLALAIVACVSLGTMLQDQQTSLPRNLTFLAPVQPAGAPLGLTVWNLEDKTTVLSVASYAWPAAVALAFWVYGWLSRQRSTRMASVLAGWLLLAWAGLRAPNGAIAFLAVLGAFFLLHVIVPAARRLWGLPSRPQSSSATEHGTAASAATALILFGLIWTCSGHTAHAESAKTAKAVPAEGIGTPMDRPRAESVSQEIRIEEKFAFATANVSWPAEKGEVLPLAFDPAVLTRVIYPSNALELMTAPVKGGYAQQLVAKRKGRFEVQFQYQLPTTQQDALTLPVQYGLINRLKLTVVNLDVDVVSPQAVSVERETAGSNTVANLVLAPAADMWVAWKPRSRDVKREKPVFYAEVTQLYAPAAGVIEGLHSVSIRPAQGELSELVFSVPPGAAITDVLDAAKAKSGAAGGSLVSLWRFDPDTRKLRVTLNPPQSRPFTLLVRSQVATGPLPFEHSVGLLSADGAAGQIGLLAVATGNEVQLDSVTAPSLSPLNLEDFPADLAPTLQAQISGLAVRRAFRIVGPAGLFSIKASPVEPDVRVETQDTVSLGEDRTVLASDAAVDITRAGIFKLSFVMPAGFDVESISGSALSHWTESRTETERVITLHLTGKTEGKQQFAVSLAGPGVRATNGWAVPQFIFREASKQRGTLLLVPEQGFRLQVAASEGLTQLDPQKSGIKQKGVLAFRVLQTPRSLSLNLEQVEPWIQVTSLQHATVTDAQIKIAANLQYQIENTGLKAFRVLIPTNAEGVRFQGEQVADSRALAGVVTNGWQAWEIKLHRRVIGPYLLQVTYQTPLPEKAPQVGLRGIQAADVNLQRGYVTIQSSGRLQIRAEASEALQLTEWQSIPRSLQAGLPTVAANFSYRLVEPAFELPLKLERHEAAALLDARVASFTLNSAISDDGVMLTQARLEMFPGDKRLLELTLPPNAKFWFAFANQNGVWPWRGRAGTNAPGQESILIPLEQSSRGDQAIPVELFYSCQVGKANPHALDLELLAPKFDLPLENITWRVSLSDKWKLKDWSGTLQLQQEQALPQTAVVDFENYLRGELSQQHERTKEAENLLAAGNAAIEKGDPQQARRAFQAAYGLSTHDAAFNEDARVQLHNIKLQQALIGLNVRQVSTAGDPATLGARFRDLHNRKEVNYTQQDAKDIIDRSSADDNAAFMRLAERLIQQQDAAVTSPAALRASIPDQGRVLTFTRAVAVNRQADLRLDLRATAARAAAWSVRALMLMGTVVLLAVFGWAARSRQEPA